MRATTTPRATATPRPTPTPTIVTSTIRVACVGDSITYGRGLPGRAENAYPSVLGRKLGREYQVRNYGVSGAAVLDNSPIPYVNQDAYQQALAFKPQILIVALGTNDSKLTFNDQKSAEFKTDYEDLIAAFKKANTSVKVYTCLPIPSYPETSRMNTTLSNVILPLIRDVSESEGAKLIDLNKPFTNRKDLYQDAFHPTVNGAALLATIVYGGLKEPTAR